jgi:hypothetical protein
MRVQCRLSVLRRLGQLLVSCQYEEPDHLWRVSSHEYPAPKARLPAALDGVLGADSWREANG